MWVGLLELRGSRYGPERSARDALAACQWHPQQIVSHLLSLIP